MSDNKIKKKVVNNSTYLEIKGEKHQQLDAVQVEAITKNRISGLLPMQVSNCGKTFKLTYNITGLKSLKEYLSETSLNKQLFGHLLQNIFNIVNELDQHHFRQEKLMLTFSKVKVDPASKCIYFLYIPIQSYDTQTPLKEFLKGIVSRAHFSDAQDDNYVVNYLGILNDGINFSKFDLQEYINTLASNGIRKEGTKKCPNCGKVVSIDTNFCSNCQYSFTSKNITGTTKNSYYNPADDPDTGDDDSETSASGEAQGGSGELEWGYIDDKKGKGGTSVIGGNFTGYQPPDPPPQPDPTQVVAPPIDLPLTPPTLPPNKYILPDVLEHEPPHMPPTPQKPVEQPSQKVSFNKNDKDENFKVTNINEEDITIQSEIGTTVLSGGGDEEEPPTDVVEQPKRYVKVGYLTRLSTNEKRKIDKDMYTVGRSMRNDFSVTGNGAVGRMHLLFRVVDDRFYIVDQNSANKTYVNLTEIPPAQNIEVFDKTQIRLANEDFIFNIVITEV